MENGWSVAHSSRYKQNQRDTGAYAANLGQKRANSMSDAGLLGQRKINHKSRKRAVPSAFRHAVLGLAAVFLASCASLVDDARDMNPTGTPFQQALYTHYLDLAVSRGTGFGSCDSADFYAERAIEAGNGVDVTPLSPVGDGAAGADLQGALDRLTNAFARGAKEIVPDMAARAQVAYDCWAHELSLGAPAAQLYQCRARFLTQMGRLEVELAPEPEPVVALPDVAEFIVYFGFDEWFLSAEALEVLSTAIDAARAGGHSKIVSAGHTDTSGPSFYNDELSVRRAEVVKLTLVEMGALPDAVEVIGYGESRLAVQTGDGVREPLNRRTVVTLVP